MAFARQLGIISTSTVFIASDGPHEANVDDLGLVDLKMIDVERIESLVDGYFLNTGVPHLVHFVDDLHTIDVELEGRQLRWDARFQPAGTNVNFVKIEGDHLTVFTYERGVEAETLACGTGITASALSAAFNAGKISGEYKITAKGGDLTVRFQQDSGRYTNIWLKGPALLVYDGFVTI